MPNNGNEKSWATIVLGDSAKFLEGLTLADKCQRRFKLIPTESLKSNITKAKGTQAGVMDLWLAKNVIQNNRAVKSSQCTIRFDKPHRGADFHHINIDPQGISSRNNPHIPVPESMINCAAKIDRCLKTVSKGLLIAAIITDGIRILGAIYEDINNKEQKLPYKTITTIAEIAGGWAGGAAGATAGALVGAKIGTCIGSLFGGVGAVIGAPIGATVGAIIGGITGAHFGNRGGGYIARQALDNHEMIGGLLDCHVNGLIVQSCKSNFLNATEWDSLFHLSFATIVNPVKAVKDVTTGLASDDPITKAKAVSAAASAVSGAAIGSVAGPVGTIVGGAVGLAAGVFYGWAVTK